jgi:predicted component of type VI protein secretion system
MIGRKDPTREMLAMPRQKLRDTLSKLHADLAATPELNPETVSQLREVMADIENLLNESSSTQHETLSARLKEAMADFENSHPRLTATVGQLADTLSGMGI